MADVDALKRDLRAAILAGDTKLAHSLRDALKKAGVTLAEIARPTGATAASRAERAIQRDPVQHRGA